MSKSGPRGFERLFEAELDQWATAEESIGDTPAGKGGFCITYKLNRVDFGNAAEIRNVSTPRGFRGEVLSILLYDVTEVFDAAETIDIGIDGGDLDAVIDGATLATGTAVDGSIRAGLIAGVTPVIPNTGAQLALSTTSVGTTGIGSLALTIRFYL